MNDGLRKRFNDKWIVTDSGCWLWTSAVSTNGYGAIWLGDRSSPAHRLSWELHRGPIPAGLCVLHRCDVPLCVNPDHLFLGTAKDNAIDKVKKGRQPRGGLGEEQIRAIRLDGRCQQSIAKDYGVSQQQIGRIKARTRWGHVA